MATEPKKKKGPPSDFSQELADFICEKLADGLLLREICRLPDMPREATIRKWALDDREGFHSQYTRAREIGYLHLFDGVIDKARNKPDKDSLTRVQRDRLEFDALRWALSKGLPKVFGDKISAEVTGSNGGPVQVAVGLKDLHDMVLAADESGGDDSGEK